MQILQTPGASPQTDAQKARKEAQMRMLMERTTQAECPVMLTSVALASKAHVQLTSKGGTAVMRDDSGALDLHFRNMSGKQIESMDISADVRVKRSVYDLDAAGVPLDFTVSGTGIVDRSSELLRSIPVNSPVFGVGRVTLDQVTYADGSVWSAGPHSACETNGSGGLHNIEAK
jgi:hypothetical protein